jgi:antitoxin component HigA of HigAB toxin-antitoxin module
MKYLYNLFVCLGIVVLSLTLNEILNRKRSLTLKMVKSLYKGLKIPAEILLA